jgi:hypothetical protein
VLTSVAVLACPVIKPYIERPVADAAPMFGVIRVGEVPNTLAPLPVEVVTPLPPDATGNGCASVTTCPVDIVTAVVVPLVCKTRLPDVSPDTTIAVPAVVPALIVDAIYNP